MITRISVKINFVRCGRNFNIGVFLKWSRIRWIQRIHWSMNWDQFNCLLGCCVSVVQWKSQCLSHRRGWVRDQEFFFFFENNTILFYFSHQGSIYCTVKETSKFVCNWVGSLLKNVLFCYRWKEVMFLRFKFFGKLTKDKPEENEDQMKYDGFFCFRFVTQCRDFSEWIYRFILLKESGGFIKPPDYWSK